MKNVPNILSSIRILLVPVFILVYFNGGEYSRVFAACVYFLASVTDVLDGWIARSFNFITNLGRILDPLGDKLMTLAVVSCLTVDRIIPLWALAFMAAKELVMIAGGAVIHKKLKTDMPPSNFFGKASTFVLFLVGVSLMLIDMPRGVAVLLIAFAMCVSALALLSYTAAFVGIWKKNCSQ